jgi:4-hydroxyphenylpyruvate dioxygenase
MGFKQIEYRALDTGSRVVTSYAFQNGDVTLVLTSPLKLAAQSEDPKDKGLLKVISDHLQTHGDAVKDVAFEVDSVDEVYYQAIENGGKSVISPHTDEDEFGSVRMATIKTYGETTHILIGRKQYSGPFLPGYKAA